MGQVTRDTQYAISNTQHNLFINQSRESSLVQAGFLTANFLQEA